MPGEKIYRLLRVMDQYFIPLLPLFAGRLEKVQGQSPTVFSVRNIFNFEVVLFSSLMYILISNIAQYLVRIRKILAGRRGGIR